MAAVAGADTWSPASFEAYAWVQGPRRLSCFLSAAFSVTLAGSWIGSEKNQGSNLCPQGVSGRSLTGYTATPAPQRFFGFVLTLIIVYIFLRKPLGYQIWLHTYTFVSVFQNSELLNNSYEQLLGLLQVHS